MLPLNLDVKDNELKLSRAKLSSMYVFDNLSSSSRKIPCSLTGLAGVRVKINLGFLDTYEASR